jgi:NADP-dependent 3-hydroxy acid dehydrogenase YdfG
LDQLGIGRVHQISLPPPAPDSIALVTGASSGIGSNTRADFRSADIGVALPGLVSSGVQAALDAELPDRGNAQAAGDRRDQHAGRDSIYSTSS